MKDKVTGGLAVDSTSDRIMSVDALRGFDMFWISGGQKIVVCFLGLFFSPIPRAITTQLSHKEWQGFAAWDLIMPLFLFIVGVSMPFSFSKYTNPLRPEYMENRGKLYVKIMRRVVILFILGMVAQGHLLGFVYDCVRQALAFTHVYALPADFHISQLSFYSNTLQSIACGYLVASILLLNVSIAAQLIATGALLYAFWFLMMLVPVPGYGAGVLEPRANLAMFVDEFVLRGFRDGTTYTWILSSITFAASVLLGVMGGHILRSSLSKANKCLNLYGVGLLCLVIGGVWSIWFPIIKHIWTSSMVMWAAGWSYLLLASFYLVIDVLGYRKWAFAFVVIGMNAIVAYMLGEVVVDLLQDAVRACLHDHLALAQALFVFGVFWIILYVMYRKKIFVRVG